MVSEREKVVFMLLPRGVMELQKRHSEFANDRNNKRLNSENSKSDFITPFMKDNVRFSEISLKETQSNIAILIPAGADATAPVISGTVLYLIRNGDKLDKLRTEIHSVLPREGDVTVKSTRDLGYLNACINEGLGLANPVPEGLPTIVPKGSYTYAGHFVPEGV
ncbi:cytochrome P450 [Bisporella sp. PMI_857]|nr:cytochrome P450 [Bisporella sp. PMI_857]